MRFIDITGKRFGRWTVLAIHPKRDRRWAVLWLCRCDCGAEHIVRGSSLHTGYSTSCGCIRREKLKKLLTKHGMSEARVYGVWEAMVQRCTNPNNADYDNYGGRGITVCEDWRSFENFFADMGEPPPGLTLDRIDNNGNYEPGNCRWTSYSVQLKNRRKVTKLSTN
jgi:hypothetical protein